VGVIPYQPVDLNTRYCSPNKLFDFIECAVPIVANDLPYLRRIVGGDGLGVVARLDGPESYADALNRVLTRADGGAELRANCRRVRARYAWAEQARTLVAAYAALEAPREPGATTRGSARTVGPVAARRADPPGRGPARRPDDARGS
jgi:hypothetical protein